MPDQTDQPILPVTEPFDPTVTRKLITSRHPKPVGNDTVDLAEAMDAQDTDPRVRQLRAAIDVLVSSNHPDNQDGLEALAAELVDAVHAAGPSRPTPHLDSVKRELAEANQKIDAYCAAFREHRAVYERALARWRLDDVQRRAIAHPGLDALLDWLMVHADEQRQRADQGEARGWQQAVDALRDGERYAVWWKSRPEDEDTYWRRTVRKDLADYLEAVGPGAGPQTGQDGGGADSP